MPNTPVFVGEVASAIALGNKATKEDSNLVSELFNSVGYCAPVPENLINAVTGVSGSGPAYVFIMIEALADGGVRAGLPRDISQKLAAQTVLGSAKMVLESGKHPGQLKDMVTSPAGMRFCRGGHHTVFGVCILATCCMALSSCSHAWFCMLYSAMMLFPTPGLQQ